MTVLRDGTRVKILCQTWSNDAVGPRANHIFDQILFIPLQNMPWIPDAYVAGTAAANQFTSGIPRCSAPPDTVEG